MTTPTNREELHDLLVEVLGNNHVYFDPPEGIKMKYPAIVYFRSNIDNMSANNSVYMQSYFYELTVIDSDPDSEIVKQISKLPTCRFNRHFTSDNLNHDVFTLFY